MGLPVWHDPGAGRFTSLCQYKPDAQASELAVSALLAMRPGIDDFLSKMAQRTR